MFHTVRLVLLFLLASNYCTCSEDSRTSSHILFYHVRKCGGWTVSNFFSRYLTSFSGNRCSHVDDFRCDLDRFGASTIQQQQIAFDKFLHSSKRFAHLETPLPMTPHFNPKIIYMTALRHPITRVVSSYHMMRSKATNGHLWTLRDWIYRNISEVSLGVYENPSPERISGELDQNYMTKWLCGIWRPGVHLHATQNHLIQAKSALSSMKYILLTSNLHSDLPALARKLQLTNVSTAPVESHNVRDISQKSEFPEHFIVDIAQHLDSPLISEYISQTPEMARDLLLRIVHVNRLDLELYQYALSLRQMQKM